MIQNITLSLVDGSEAEFEMMACGTTAIRYKQLFGRELLGAIASVLKSFSPEMIASITQMDGDIDLDDIDANTLSGILSVLENDALSAVSEVAYIMNAQARGEQMNALSYDKYLAWMEQFDTMTFMQSAMPIIQLYMNNRAGSSVAKKKQGKQIGQ